MLGVEKLLAEEAKERQREAGGDRKSEEYQKSVVQISGQPIESNRVTKQAAQLLNTNHEYVSTAKRIEKEAPELLSHVIDGVMQIVRVSGFSCL